MHKNTKNIIGQRFGRLVVVGISTERSHGAHIWICLCDCGKTTKVSTGNIKKKQTKSCGCFIKEIMKIQQQPTHGMTHTRPYNIWSKMKSRCQRKNDKDYKNYGRRGIKICKEWNIFENFWKDVKNIYSESLTMDRINNNDDYKKDNVRWITMKEQINNTRVNKLITYKGRTQTQSQWCDEVGIHRCVLAHRLSAGWDVNIAMETPVKKYNMKRKI